MEEAEIKDINDFCFRIFFDFGLVDLDKFLDSLGKYGDFIFYNNCIYIWLFEKDNKSAFLKFIKKTENKIKPSTIFINSLLLIDVKGRDDFLEIFVNEHYTSLLIEILENKKQAELKKMLDNINKANQELEKIKNLEKEEKEGLRNA